MGPQLPVPHLGTTIIYQALPAQQGTDFDGPDPGLNAAIICKLFDVSFTPETVKIMCTSRASNYVYIVCFT